MYKLTNGVLIELATGSLIGQLNDNLDYQKYLEWITQGNTPQGYDLEEMQAMKLAEIDGWYQTAITADIAYMGCIFQADYPTHDNIKSVISCGEVPNGFCWFDINNNPIPMTFPELLGFSKALVFRGAIAFAKKQGLKAQVRELTDIDATKAITW